MNSKQDILKALDAVVGTWDSKGTMRTPDGTIAITGTDAYEWLPGQQFMIHKADVTVGGDKVDVIEIIGEYDEAKKACAMHAFQSDGSHEVMWANVNTNGSLLFAGDTTRATLTTSQDGKAMDALWEQRTDGNWNHWMDMRFTKQ